jgi:hypothetical protein
VQCDTGRLVKLLQFQTRRRLILVVSRFIISFNGTCGPAGFKASGLGQSPRHRWQTRADLPGKHEEWDRQTVDGHREQNQQVDQRLGAQSEDVEACLRGYVRCRKFRGRYAADEDCPHAYDRGVANGN